MLISHTDASLALYLMVLSGGTIFEEMIAATHQLFLGSFVLLD